MQSDYDRYAIYWIPQRGTALAEFGCAWTGWCADGAQRQPFAKAFQKTGDPGGLAQTGLHAPLTAPFELHRGHSLWGLQRVIEGVAAATQIIPLPRLTLIEAHGALTLGARSMAPALERMLTGLHQSVKALCKGAPAPVRHFQIPLTLRGGTRSAEAARPVLAPFLDPILRRPQALTDVALMGDPGGDRPWRVIERFALARAVARVEGGPAGMACAGPSLIAPLEVAGIAV